MKRVCFLLIVLCHVFVLPWGIANATIQPTEGIPAAPSNLYFKITSSDSVKLYWSDNSNNETKFVLERREQDGSFSQIASINMNTVYFVDTGLVPNQTYQYKVKAVNQDGASDYSNIVDVTLYAADLPSPPETLSAALTPTGNIELSWRDNTSNELGFKIERKTAEGIFETIAIVDVDSTYYLDSKVCANTTYFYRVRAYNAYGKSDYSNEVSLFVPSVQEDGLPMAPSIVAVKRLSNNSVKIYWKDNSQNEEGFVIERKQADGSFTEIARVERNVVYYIDEGVQINKAYIYRIYAYNVMGQSNYSNTAEIVLESVTVPDAPVHLKAVSNSDSVQLTWVDKSNNETGFKVERKTEGGYFETIAVIDANKSSFLDKNISLEKTYYYRIRSYNSAGKSAYSNEIKVMFKQQTEEITDKQSETSLKDDVTAPETVQPDVPDTKNEGPKTPTDLPVTDSDKSSVDKIKDTASVEEIKSGVEEKPLIVRIVTIIKSWCSWLLNVFKPNK